MVQFQHQSSLADCDRDGRRFTRRAFVCASFVVLIIGLGGLPSEAFVPVRNSEVLRSLTVRASDRISPNAWVGKVSVRSLQPVPPSVRPRGPNADWQPRPGERAFDLRIPSIGIDEVVYQGADLAQLAKGPGHYPACSSGFAPPYCAPFDEVWPGQRGRVVIGGHRTLAHADFFRIGELRQGRRIYVSTPWGNFTYAVTSTTIVSPYDRTIIVPGITERQLVLVSCHPKYSSAQRLLVFARLKRATAPDESRAPATRTLRALH
jgi:LPXTG-site transpeptidase (sortase) family protein